MNTLYKVEAFVDRETKVEASDDPPFVLKMVVDDTILNFYLTMTAAAPDELEAGVAFLDNLVVAAFDVRTRMLKRLATSKEEVRS